MIAHILAFVADHPVFVIVASVLVIAAMLVLVVSDYRRIGRRGR